MPDPSANPYLALGVQLAAGLDGVQERTDPGEPVNKNIARMSHRERRRVRIDDLPRDLHAALDSREKDAAIGEALGRERRGGIAEIRQSIRARILRQYWKGPKAPLGQAGGRARQPPVRGSGVPMPQLLQQPRSRLGVPVASRREHESP